MRCMPPKKPLPGVNASEYPTANHNRLTTAVMPTTAAMVLSTFLRRTMPA